MIKDQNGNGLYPLQVVLKINSDPVPSYGYGYTDITGLLLRSWLVAPESDPIKGVAFLLSIKIYQLYCYFGP